MKRKTLVIVLVLFIIICILGYIFIKITNPTKRAVVVKVNDQYGKSLLVIDVKDKTPYHIGLPTDINLQFKQGQEIMIYHKCDMIVELSYPSSISSKYIKKVKILKEKSNIRNTK